MSLRHAAIVVCGVVACRGGGVRANTAPAGDTTKSGVVSVSAQPTGGMFEYTAMIKNTELRGRFAVSGRVIIFELAHAECHATGAPDWTASIATARYECRNAALPAPVVFNIDVRSPVGRSTWQLIYTEQRTRNVCVEYVSRSGRNVCARMQSQIVDVVVPLTGQMLVRRLASSANPK